MRSALPSTRHSPLAAARVISEADAPLTQHDDAITAANDWTVGNAKLSKADETLAQRGEGSVGDFGPHSRVPGVTYISPSASEIDELDETDQ